MTSERETGTPNQSNSFRGAFDKSPERPFRFYLRDDSSSRGLNQGMHQRNRSYDFLLTNKSMK